MSGGIDIHSIKTFLSLIIQGKPSIIQQQYTKRNKPKERKRHPKHKTNNQEKGIKHYPYFHGQ
jgi:hypothetical protein